MPDAHAAADLHGWDDAARDAALERVEREPGRVGGFRQTQQLLGGRPSITTRSWTVRAWPVSTPLIGAGARRVGLGTRPRTFRSGFGRYGVATADTLPAVLTVSTRRQHLPGTGRIQQE